MSGFACTMLLLTCSWSLVCFTYVGVTKESHSNTIIVMLQFYAISCRGIHLADSLFVVYHMLLDLLFERPNQVVVLYAMLHILTQKVQFIFIQKYYYYYYYIIHVGRVPKWLLNTVASKIAPRVSMK